MREGGGSSFGRKFERQMPCAYARNYYTPTFTRGKGWRWMGGGREKEMGKKVLWGKKDSRKSAGREETFICPPTRARIAHISVGSSREIERGKGEIGRSTLQRRLEIYGPHKTGRESPLNYGGKYWGGRLREEKKRRKRNLKESSSEGIHGRTGSGTLGRERKRRRRKEIGGGTYNEHSL